MIASFVAIIVMILAPFSASTGPPPSTLPTAPQEIGEIQATLITQYVDSVTLQAYIAYQASVDAANAARYAQAVAETQAETQREQARPAPRYNAPAAPAPTSNPGGFLSCVRQRESGGNYGIYNSGGSGAAGAYQFLPGTWNGIAASVGRTDLIGVSPAAASPADQDAMAQALYAQQGTAPWAGGNYTC